jgi:uncharacterized protein YcaQ
MDICRRIFEFDYQLETYKPVARHRWVFRIADLVRRPVGKLDAMADQKAGLLGVDAILWGSITGSGLYGLPGWDHR